MSPEIRDQLNRNSCGSAITLIEELERKCPPNEQGTNRFGLDISYFRNVINRELNGSLLDFKPSELARVFARLSRTADKSVMFEPEFAAEHDGKVRVEVAKEIAMNVRQDYGHHIQYSVSLLCAGLDGYTNSFERQADRYPDIRKSCELECGAYGTYCKCNAEQAKGGE